MSAVEEQTKEQAKEPTQAEQLAEEVVSIEPRGKHKTWTVGPPDQEMSYVQKPLSFFAKMKMFARLGEAVDVALAAEGVSLQALLGGVTGPRGMQGMFSATDIADADQFMRLIARLLQYAPDLLLDLYVIWLAVPEGEKEWAKWAMQQPEDEGGFSDSEGFEIVELFYDQNAEAMRSFFDEKIKPLIARARAARAKDAEASAPSRPSKTTRPRTRKASKSS